MPSTSNTCRNDLLKQPKSDDQPLFPPEVLLKVLEAADTPVDVMAAVCRSLQQAVLVQDPRRLSLTIDPARSAELGAGLASLAWLSHTSGSNSGHQRRAGPLRLILKHAAGSGDTPCVIMLSSAARVLLHTPLRVVTHLELAFPNDISQADVDLLGSRMPLLRSFSMEQNQAVVSLDLKPLSQLEVAHVNKCACLADLSVTGCSRLQELLCQSNKLTALDISGCAQLRLLECDDNSELANLMGLGAAGTSTLEHLSVYNCTALTYLDLSQQLQLRKLWLPCEHGAFTGLSLPPSVRLELLQISARDMLATLISSGHIASLKSLCLHQFDFHVDMISTVPGLQELYLTECELPEQWVLAALPALSSLAVGSCTNLTSLDASAATAVTSLTLEDLPCLQSLVPPAGLKVVTFERLPELDEVDLRASPDVKVDISGCPALRLCMTNLTLKP
jgi:hypothetical protein